MSKHQEDIELIERFFRQELTPDEMLDFEMRVKSDADFVKELTAMRDLFYGIKQAARQNLKLELQDIEAEVLLQGVKPYYGGLKIWMKWFWGILLGAILGYLLLANWHRLDFHAFKSNHLNGDSIIENGMPEAPTGGQTFIKDASDSTFNGIPADLKLELSDTAPLEVIQTSSQNGIYQYKIVTPQGDYLVNSPISDLDSQLLRRRRQSQNSSTKKKSEASETRNDIDQ